MIGSEAGCDVVVAETGVAGRHAQLVLDGGKVLVEDLGGGSGTKLNGLTVQGSSVVRSGDSIQLCGWSAEVRMMEPARLDPQQEAPIHEHSPARPFLSRIIGCFRAASRRIALASKLRCQEAALTSSRQDLDAARIAIGEKAEQMAAAGNMCDWRAEVADVLADVARAAGAMAADKEVCAVRIREMVCISESAEAARTVHEAKVRGLDRERAELVRDTAVKEQERQKSLSEIGSVNGKLSLIQNAIAGVGSSASAGSAEDLLATKAALTRKLADLTEAADAAAAAVVRLKELAAGKARDRDSAAKEGSALKAEELAAADALRNARADADRRASRSAKALQEARSALGRALMLVRGAAPEGFAELYGIAKAAEAGVVERKARISSIRAEMEGIGPDVRRFAFGVAVSAVLAVSTLAGIAYIWNRESDGVEIVRGSDNVCARVLPTLTKKLRNACRWNGCETESRVAASCSDVRESKPSLDGTWRAELTPDVELTRWEKDFGMKQGEYVLSLSDRSGRIRGNCKIESRMREAEVWGTRKGKSFRLYLWDRDDPFSVPGGIDGVFGTAPPELVDSSGIPMTDGWVARIEGEITDSGRLKGAYAEGKNHGEWRTSNWVKGEPKLTPSSAPVSLFSEPKVQTQQREFDAVRVNAGS